MNKIFFRNSGETSLTIKSPDTITNWLITGHQWSQGLCSAKSANELTTFRRFFLTANIPRYVYVKERIRMTVNAHMFERDSFGGEQTSKEVIHFSIVISRNS
jgi:uncharacterized protein YfaS (alpha-2-macroglobulin family)